MLAKVKEDRTSLRRIHICVITLLAISTRFLLSERIDYIYYVDSYYYLAKAISISEGNAIPLTRGFPFIYALGGFIRFLSPIVGPADATKLFLSIVNLSLFCAIYLALTYLMSETHSFFATVFSIFQLSLLEYSLVPYIEVFALLNAWISILMIFHYFRTCNLKPLLGGFIFSILAGLARFEMFIILYLPIVIVTVIRSFVSSQRRDKQVGLIIMASNAMILPVFWNDLIAYYFSTTRFDPLTKLALGLRSEVIVNGFNSIFTVTGIQGLDFSYMLMFVIGVIATTSSILLTLNRESLTNWKEKRPTLVKDIFTDTKKTTLLTYVLLILNEYLILIAYGYSYTIADGSVRISVDPISTRRLIGIQILLVPSIVYFVSNMYPKVKTIRVPRYKCGVRISTNTIITICLLAIYLPNMWFAGLEKVGANSDTMAVYSRTAKWLVDNLNSNQQALLPLEEIFYFYEPELRDRTVSFGVIWEKAGVMLKADTTSEELFRVRKALINYTIEHPVFKHVVVDWIDPITKVFQLEGNDELELMLKPVHVEKVQAGTYRPEIVTYEVRKPHQIFEFSFTGGKNQEYKVQSYNFGNFVSNYTINEGLTISMSEAYADSVYRVYLSFNVSDWENFSSPYSLAFSLKFRSHLEENCQILFTMYFDKNGDGAFDYNHDYVTSFNPLSKPAKLDSEHYLFLKAIYDAIGKPIQIGISLEATGYLNGSEATIEDIKLFTID